MFRFCTNLGDPPPPAQFWRCTLVWVLGDISVFLTSPRLLTSHPDQNSNKSAAGSFKDCCFSFMFQFFFLFSVFLVLLFSFPWPPSPHTHTNTHRGTVNRFVRIHPTVSHFHYKTERIWAAAWIASPHLWLSYIFQEVGWAFCLPALSLLSLQWMFECVWGGRVHTVSGWPFKKKQKKSLIPCLFPLLSGVIHAWPGKKPSLLSTKPTCIWWSGLQKHSKASWL